MKKTTIFLCAYILIVFILSACSNGNATISEIGTWKMESVANSDGEFIVHSNYADNDSNLSCTFYEDNTFSLSGDKIDNWSGTYTKVTADNALSLTLEFSNKSIANAVCGKREYNNGNIVDSLIITTDEKIISFLREPYDK